MFAYIVCASLLIVGGFSALDTCGIENTTIPQLKVQVYDGSNSQTDDKIAASIYVDGEWTPWYRIDHGGCDNFDKGMTNYFDEFASYDSASGWEAIALYNCGKDGLEIDAIGYWNGADSTSLIDFFCFNVAGPFEEDCFTDLDEHPNGQCYDESSSAYYDGVWIDQNNAGCQGIQFFTGKTLFDDPDDTLVAKYFFASTPGSPDCGNLLLDETEDVEAEFSAKGFSVEQWTTLPRLHWSVYAALLAFLVIVVFKMYQNRSSAAYKALADEDTEYSALKAQIQN